jgi:hypothetical protein
MSARHAQMHSPGEIRDRELQWVCQEVQAHLAAAQAPWPAHTAEPFAFQYFSIDDSLSVAGVAVLGGQFVKLRLTYFDEPKMREVMGETIRELSRMVVDAAAKPTVGPTAMI